MRGIIYDKVHKMDLLDSKYFGVGPVTTLMTGDVFMVGVIVTMISSVSKTPSMFIGASIYLFFSFGYIALLIPLIILLNVIVQYTTSKVSSKFTGSRFAISSKRAKLVTESINGIKNIKTNSWEDLVKDKINNLRI